MDKNGQKSTIFKYKATLVRRILIKNPDITATRLAKKMKWDRKTATKYLKYVKESNIRRTEAQIDSLKKKPVEAELAEMETENKEVLRYLWSIAANKKVKDSDRVAALRAIQTVKKDLFGLKFDAGLFIKSLGKLDINVPELVRRIRKENESSGDNSESSL